MANADDPNGPLQRFDKPIIGISAYTTAHDAQMVANPLVTHMPDGRFLMVYKAVTRKKPQLFGGQVVHLTAIADKPEGHYVKQYKPIFTAENIDFPPEDPFVWYQNNCYYDIVKDMKGSFTNAGRSLVLFYSIDGLGWKPNAARYYTSKSIMGEWSYHGNPCHGYKKVDSVGIEKTYGGQSSYIIPVQGVKDAYIAMFDIWRPENPVTGRYIWLPVEWKDGKMSVTWWDSWNLREFGQNSMIKK